MKSVNKIFILLLIFPCILLSSEKEYVIMEDTIDSYVYYVDNILILNSHLNKYNYYIVPRSYNWDIEQILANIRPQSLEIAQKKWPSYCLDEKNYGF